MNCPAIRDRLGAYVDNEVDADLRGAIDAHVATCAACACELRQLRALAGALIPAETTAAPAELWPRIAAGLAELPTQRVPATAPRHLDQTSPLPRSSRIFSARRFVAAAAVLVVAVGVGLLLFPSGSGGGAAQAGTIDFTVLLRRLPLNPDEAFTAFLAQYRPEPVTPAEARAAAPGLTFELPEVVAHGFRRVAVYKLRFGEQLGVAARYHRDGELLAFVFHPPVLQMKFSERENSACGVGKVDGEFIDLGEWTLSHLTDPTTCHCVLTKLDRTRELPAVLAQVAPTVSDVKPARPRRQ